jgi:hypothetical protein
VIVYVVRRTTLYRKDPGSILTHAFFRSWYNKPLEKERAFKVMAGDQLRNVKEKHLILF